MTAINSPAPGPRTVRRLVAETLPDHILVRRTEIERLTRRLEDLEDRRAVDAATVGRGDFLPEDLVRRLIAGEHPLRVWRNHRDMTLDHLAKAAGVGKAYLSQIENGHKNGSVRVLRACGHALDVDLDDLIS
jgi:DNA-binding XRE family transcriptional regulator